MALYDFFTGFLLPLEAVAILVLLFYGGYRILEESQARQAEKRAASLPKDASEGVTPVASILFAEESEDDRRDRHTLFVILDIPQPGADMPAAMMRAYDTPIAVSPELHKDIKQLLAELAARP